MDTNMSWIGNVLRRWGVLDPFSADEVLNAESENALRDVEKGREAVSDAYAKNTESAEKLRTTMRAVRHRAATFAQFEERIRTRTRGH